MCRRAGPRTVGPASLATLLPMHSNHSPEGHTAPHVPEVSPIYDEGTVDMGGYAEGPPMGGARLATDLTQLLHPVGGRRRTLQRSALPKERSHKNELN